VPLYGVVAYNKNMKYRLKRIVFNGFVYCVVGDNKNMKYRLKHIVFNGFMPCVVSKNAIQRQQKCQD
jgi:hypothetical protein